MNTDSAYLKIIRLLIKCSLMTAATVSTQQWNLLQKNV